MTTTFPTLTTPEDEQARDAALDAIALIGKGIQALRVATDDRPALRATMHTRALRELVGAGPRVDSDAANWVQTLRAERANAFRKLLQQGVVEEDIARACWMTSKRVTQVVSLRSGYQATGRPNGRPVGSIDKATVEAEALETAARLAEQAAQGAA